MVAADKTRNGVENLDGEVLQGSHIDCATQVRVNIVVSSGFNGESYSR